MGDSHANGSSPSYALRGIKYFTGANHDQFGDWYKKACFTLSIARPDVFYVLEGQTRPNTTTSGATESGAAALYPPRPARTSTSPPTGRRNLNEGAVQGKNGALSTRRPRTTTPSATRKELRTHRPIVRIRRLWGRPHLNRYRRQTDY